VSADDFPLSGASVKTWLGGSGRLECTGYKFPPFDSQECYLGPLRIYLTTTGSPHAGQTAPEGPLSSSDFFPVHPHVGHWISSGADTGYKEHSLPGQKAWCQPESEGTVERVAHSTTRFRDW